ncbi:MAG: ATP-binding domain-containing protein, partial [Chloroflexota bacterium]
VLSGAPLHRSAAWRERHAFSDPLWNGNVRDDGRPAGRPADQVPGTPDDVILCDTIRRFKGLDQKVVVLVELDPADPRLETLLYVGVSRAREHLVVIAPPAVCDRLR